MAGFSTSYFYTDFSLYIITASSRKSDKKNVLKFHRNVFRLKRGGNIFVMTKRLLGIKAKEAKRMCDVV